MIDVDVDLDIDLDLYGCCYKLGVHFLDVLVKQRHPIPWGSAYMAQSRSNVCTSCPQSRSYLNTWSLKAPEGTFIRGLTVSFWATSPGTWGVLLRRELSQGTLAVSRGFAGTTQTRLQLNCSPLRQLGTFKSSLQNSKST